jgi:hypothetical protein
VKVFNGEKLMKRRILILAFALASAFTLAFTGCASTKNCCHNKGDNCEEKDCCKNDLQKADALGEGCCG